MAAYFQLTRIGSKEPAFFQTIDNEICQNLGLSWDADAWAEDWYDIIGLRIALGKTFQDNTDYFNECIAEGKPKWEEHYRTLLRINHFLLENYITDNWQGR